ncbi:MAG: ribosome biogenesis GTPase Der, partial [Firmicutes bacterium]|nr:ribosome biogenesis GTPase Der [Bacillota bacterium]
QLSFLSYAPLLFISARTGRGVQRLFPLIDTVANNRKISIPTAHLNSILTEAVNLRPPSARRGRVGKIFYATQTSYSPPVFLLFVNDPHLFHFSYLRYLENKLREGYDFTGTPLRLRLRKRP